MSFFHVSESVNGIKTWDDITFGWLFFTLGIQYAIRVNCDIKHAFYKWLDCRLYYILLDIKLFCWVLTVFVSFITWREYFFQNRCHLLNRHTLLLPIHSNLMKVIGLIEYLYKKTSDYASPGFVGLRYMAPWTDWRFLPFWRFWQLFGNFFGPFWSLDNLW